MRTLIHFPVLGSVHQVTEVGDVRAAITSGVGTRRSGAGGFRLGVLLHSVRHNHAVDEAPGLEAAYGTPPCDAGSLRLSVWTHQATNPLPRTFQTNTRSFLALRVLVLSYFSHAATPPSAITWASTETTTHRIDARPAGRRARPAKAGRALRVHGTHERVTARDSVDEHRPLGTLRSFDNGRNLP